MTKSTDIRIVDISTNLENILYRTPMKFGGRVVTDVTLFNVNVTVETTDGRQGKGHGSMPVGNAWGWPSAVETGDRTLEAMIRVRRTRRISCWNITAIWTPYRISTRSGS